MTERATVAATLDRVRSQLGTGETPPGSNCQPYSHALHRPCEAWCADFATVILGESGLLTDIIKGSPAARVLADQFQNAARLHRGDPQPGDLAFFIWPGDTVIHHVSFVEVVRSAHPLEIVDIGGNTADHVTRSVRRANIAGFGRPDYATAADRPTPHPGPHKPPPHPVPHGEPSWYKRILRNTGDPHAYLHGADVNHVQHVVGARADGYYGPVTAARVKSWQTAHHAQPYDGIVGPITARAMG